MSIISIISSIASIGRIIIRGLELLGLFLLGGRRLWWFLVALVDLVRRIAKPAAATPKVEITGHKLLLPLTRFVSHPIRRAGLLLISNKLEVGLVQLVESLVNQ